jgi:two-component system copper resistance phosphate regulon response regulator CusR
MRILIVEDDHKLGALLEQGLQEDGFEVGRAGDGEEAIAKAKAADYDLILLDYMLPKKNGYDVTVELRRAGRQMPILMLTARDAPEDLRQALQAGVSELMGKPFRFDELVDRIRSLASDSPNGR